MIKKFATKSIHSCFRVMLPAQVKSLYLLTSFCRFHAPKKQLRVKIRPQKRNLVEILSIVHGRP